MDIDQAAAMTHHNPAVVWKWIEFRSKAPVPIACWVIMNLATLANKDITFPPGMRDYLHAVLPGSIVGNKPPVHPRATDWQKPPSLPLFTKEQIRGIVNQSGLNIAEIKAITHETAAKIENVLDPEQSDKILPPCSLELLLLTLINRRLYFASDEFISFVVRKYNGNIHL